jgi:NADH-quinone oxidoreductase subunit F
MGPDKAFCDLAPGAMQPLEAALRLFRDDFVQHIEEGRCPYGRNDRSDAPPSETAATPEATA